MSSTKKPTATKRGRKPKIITHQPPLGLSSEQSQSELKVYSTTNTKKKSKQVKQQESDIDEVIILRLKIDINNLTNNTNTPMPYSTMGYEYEHFSENMLKTRPNIDTVQYKQKHSNDPVSTSINIANEIDTEHDTGVLNKVLDSMLEYSEAKKHKKWPKHVNIACFWCSEFFDTIPVGIPVKVETKKVGIGKKQKTKNIYYCEDNYCTFECAVADLFKQKHGKFRESYSLLCSLYKEAHNLPKVKKILSALPKKALARYGGPHSVEKFRELSKVDEVTYTVIDPPMIPVLSQIETNYMKFNDANRSNSFIPINKQLTSNPVTNPSSNYQVPMSSTGIHNNNTLLRFMKPLTAPQASSTNATKLPSTHYTEQEG